MIRLVALDLDGTLLGPDWRVAEEDSEAVREALARGVHVVLNTSRWYGVALRTHGRLQLETPLACHNGVHVCEPGGDELLHLRVPADIAREIAQMCDEGGWETYTTVNGVTYMRSRWEERIDPARLPKDMRLAKTHAQHVTQDATGFVVFGDDAVAQLTETFDARYPGALAFPVGIGEAGQQYVTITARGADKGTAHRLICERLAVSPEESMAVGDAMPDAAMFEAAQVGVAMGNASDDLKALADAVAPTNAEGGVAWAIRRYVFEDI
jgi:hypothetical protein